MKMSRLLTRPKFKRPQRGIILPAGGVKAPANFMPFSEDVTQFLFVLGGTGIGIPHVFSNGATIVVDTKVAVPDLPGGEAGKGFTCSGLCQDPDSTNLWSANFGLSRNGGGGASPPASLVQLTADGGTLVSQAILPNQSLGGLQGIAFVTSPSLRCLAYVSGADANVYFINRDATVPRGPLALTFTANALAWDDVLQGFWIGDANSGASYLITLNGVVLRYADWASWGGPLDHLCVDPSRGTGGYLWAQTGVNGAPAILIAYDKAKDQIVNRYLLDSLQAGEGILVNGLTVKGNTDGYFHSFGSGPNTVAPYNVNELQTYTLPDPIPQWRYARLYKAGELAGPYGRQPYHLILDRGDGDTSADFCVITRNSDVPAGVANIAWSGKSFDPLSIANMGLRLPAGGLTNVVYGAAYSRGSISATATLNSVVQLGTRGTMTPDRTVNAVGTALAVNVGAVPVPYRARLGA